MIELVGTLLTKPGGKSYFLQHLERDNAHIYCRANVMPSASNNIWFVCRLQMSLCCFCSPCFIVQCLFSLFHTGNFFVESATCFHDPLNTEIIYPANNAPCKRTHYIRQCTSHKTMPTGISTYKKQCGRNLRSDCIILCST